MGSAAEEGESPVYESGKGSEWNPEYDETREI